MKGFNVFLAVLIFLLAVTSAVFSFFLFEKRTQLINSYGFMGQQYAEATKLLDANSGTQLAGKITQESLNHDRSANLPELMKEFIDMTKAVVNERDVLAGSLSNISRRLSASISQDKFARLDSYGASVKQLEAAVNQFRSRTDDIIRKISSSASRLGASVPASQLHGSGYARAYQSLDTRIAFWTKRNKDYESRVRNVASAIGSKAPALSEKSYETDLNNLVTAARQVRSDKDKYHQNWKQEERTRKNLEVVIKNKDKSIASLKQTIQKRENEIARLNKVLGLESPREPMRDGSLEALNLVKTQQKGVVLDVDNKFGFVVVSLGKNTRVQEQFGNRVNNVDPQIPEGTILTVARDLSSGDAEYINKLKIVRLDDNASIAEPIDKKGGKRIRRGDNVYLADDEIAKLIKNRK